MSAIVSKPAVEAWQKLMLVVDHLRREVGRDTRAYSTITDTEFTVLAHLSACSSRGARPRDCARAIGWDSSRLSHVLRRMERRDLIESLEPAVADGRASVIRATHAGRRAYRKTLLPHFQSVGSWFADALSAAQIEQLIEILDALAAHAESRNASSNVFPQHLTHPAARSHS